MKHFIYADNAATTKLDKDAFNAMLPWLQEEYGNASQPYSFARKPKKALMEARTLIAECIGAQPDEIYFTSGGTESDNWAIKGIAEKGKKHHTIATQIEHHAILNACRRLEHFGFQVDYLPVDKQGVVSCEDLVKFIKGNTELISVMMVNNEIGTIEPIKEIGEIAHRHGILFHTDAVQAFGQIPIHVDEMNIDMLSASGHKFNGPKGIGFLYIKKGLKLKSFIHGGQQERGRRAGTENVPGIVGIAKACEIAMAEMEERMKKETELRDYLIERILKEIPYTRLNGHSKKRLPNNVNISFQFVEGESILIMLDMAGICASSGSACTSGSVDPSHVLLAIGLPHEIAHGSLRLTIGYENTKEEMDAVVDNLKRIITNLRNMSPLYEDYVKKNHIQ